MSEPHTARFERHTFEFGDLVNTLAEDGFVWGRDFVLLGFPQPDAFELVFQNGELAARASTLWAAKTQSDEPRSWPKAGEPTGH